MNSQDKLRPELPGLTAEQCRRLVKLGVQSRSDVEDLVISRVDGPQRFATLLKISREELKRLLGWPRWPDPRAVALGATIPVSGVARHRRRTSMGSLPRCAPSPTPAVSLPDHISLTERYSAARNQGILGTCTAFATVAVVEGQSAAADLSEAFLYGLTKSIDGLPQSDGSSLGFALEALHRWGVCREELKPYLADRAYLRGEPSTVALRDGLRRCPASRELWMLPPRNVDAIKDQLASGRPVAISVPLFQSVMNSLLFHGQGRFLLRLGRADLVHSYHALCIVAYFDNTWLLQHQLSEQPGGGAFLVRNSWGPQWAVDNPLARLQGCQGGYALMPYAYVAKYAVEACTACFTRTTLSPTVVWDHVSRTTRVWIHQVAAYLRSSLTNRLSIPEREKPSRISRSGVVRRSRGKRKRTARPLPPSPAGESD